MAMGGIQGFLISIFGFGCRKFTKSLSISHSVNYTVKLRTKNLIERLEQKYADMSFDVFINVKYLIKQIEIYK